MKEHLAAGSSKKKCRALFSSTASTGGAVAICSAVVQRRHCFLILSPTSPYIFSNGEICQLNIENFNSLIDIRIKYYVKGQVNKLKNCFAEKGCAQMATLQTLTVFFVCSISSIFFFSTGSHFMNQHSHFLGWDTSTPGLL